MLIYVYSAVLLLYLVLAFLAHRREKANALTRKEPGYLTAAYLYHLYLRVRRKKFPEILQESRVKRDLAALHPGRYPENREEKCQIGWIRRSLLIILAGDILAMTSFSVSGLSQYLQQDGSLIREQEGGEDQAVTLTGRQSNSQEEAVREETVELTLHAARLSEKETDRLEQELVKALPQLILQENKDLQHVNSRLFLPAEVQGYPFSIVWESSSYMLIDSDGTVSANALEGKETSSVQLTAVISYDDGTPAGKRYEETFDVSVIPAPVSEEDSFRNSMRTALDEAEQQNLSERRVLLPEQIEGSPVEWREKQNDRSVEIFLLFLTAGILAVGASSGRLHSRVIQRDKEIELAYPQIVSKMALYLGAGTSMRGCFVRLGESYLQSREAGGKACSVYEEILLVCRELESGVPETEAYAGFGKRCRSRQYTRLCSLLLQNLRKGNKSLLSALQEEARAAVENRRNRARETGEEAQTKLLLPMGMMLVITTVMIIVPAYYAFSM